MSTCSPALVPLEGASKHYDWGSPRAIPELLGRSADGRPVAEYWLGAHPEAPARARLADREIGLGELVASDPERVLGSGVARAFGGELPFLFKVLAAASTLSIQCHPNREQARAGFEREELAGVPRDAPERSYRDANHKPELIVALERFSALKGFRPPAEIRAALEAAGVDGLRPEMDALAGEGGLERFFRGVMGLEPGRRRRVLAELEAGAGALAGPESRWCAELLSRYPGDAGALAPLYLHLVELEPGQALFLPAQELHAYLEGFGLEIMATSDNVLRGGLTSKHVDVAELLAVLAFEPGDATPLEPEERGALRAYRTPTPEFSLASVRLEAGAPLERGARPAVEILLATEGSARAVEPGGDAVDLSRGRAALVPAALPSYRLEGEGRIWIATVPPACR